MITQAAVLCDGAIHTLPRPARHGDVLHDLYNKKGLVLGTRQGFINERGEFLTRAEAAIEAFRCGQIKTPKPCLFTEDLW